MIGILMAGMAMGAEPCLTGKLAVKERLLSTLGWDVTRITVALKNDCTKKVVAYRGLIHLASPDGQISTVLTFYSDYHPIDVGGNSNSQLSYYVWDTPADIWLHSVAIYGVNFTWNPTMVVFEDGTVAMYPSVLKEDMPRQQPPAEHAPPSATAK